MSGYPCNAHGFVQSLAGCDSTCTYPNLGRPRPGRVGIEERSAALLADPAAYFAEARRVAREEAERVVQEHMRRSRKHLFRRH